MIPSVRRLSSESSVALVVAAAFLVACPPTDDDDSSMTTSPSEETPTVPPVTPTTCVDADQDGFCISEGDCRDDDSAINPSALEVCEIGSPIDNNCDTVEGCYVDDDGDGYTEMSNDCDDTRPLVSPIGTEVCDQTLDENCNGVEGEGCPYYDDDKDGQSDSAGDCDDQDPSIYQGALELFDGVDNNCDGAPEQILVLEPDTVLALDGTEVNSSFGWSLAGLRPLEGTTGSFNGDGYADLAVGASTAGGSSLQGAVTVYYGGAGFGDTGTPAGVTFEESQAVARAGFSVAALGDLDLNGSVDLGIGAPEYDTKSEDAGRLYVLLGGSSFPAGSLEGVSSSLLPGIQEGDHVGYGVSGGNVNGDYFDDILVGSPNGANGGYLQIVPGGSSIQGNILPTELAYLNPDGMEDVALGQSVAFAGDVNGDSTGDILVGAPYSASREGAVIWVPGADTLDAGVSYSSFEDASAVVLRGDEDGENAGFSLSGAGDVNGDGASDFIAADESNTKITDPVAFLFLGGPSFLGGSPAPGNYSLGDEATVAFMAPDVDVCPCSVALDGDLNADGYSDILVGTAGDATVYLFMGRESFPSQTLYLAEDAEYIFRSDDPDDWSGYSVAWTGSLDGDAYDDFAIGAPYADGDVSVKDNGRVFILFGFGTP